MEFLQQKKQNINDNLFMAQACLTIGKPEDSVKYIQEVMRQFPIYEDKDKTLLDQVFKGSLEKQFWKPLAQI